MKKNFVIVFVLLLILFTNGCTNKKCELVKEEYQEIRKTSNTLFAEIQKIEQIYEKNGLLYYTDFSQENLKQYNQLIEQAIINNQNERYWLINNEKCVKSWGTAELALTELLKDIRESTEQLEEIKLKSSIYLKN